MSRPKAPEQTRQQLLKAAVNLILTKGATQLTLDQVAADAGVSKGGLLHHYPTKDALVFGLMKLGFASFEDRIQRHLQADPSPTAGRWLRAYIHATFESAPDEERLTQALFMLTANSPELIEAKKAELSALFSHMEIDDIAPERAWVVRLACDALWSDDLVGLLQIDESMRQRLRDELLRLVDYP